MTSFQEADRVATFRPTRTEALARSFHEMATHRGGTPPEDAKQAILDYCLRKGALAAGVADLEAVDAMPLTATRKIVKSRLTERVSPAPTPSA